MYLSRRIEAAKQEVLGVTAQFLIDHPDAEVRIADICKFAEMSSTVIYNYFHSREGLIDATYLYLYKQQESLFDEGIINCLNSNLEGPFSILNVPLPEGSETPFQYFEPNRGSRLRIYVRSVGREKFSKQLKEVQTEHFARLSQRIISEFAGGPFILNQAELIKTLSLADTLLLARAINQSTTVPLEDSHWAQIVDTCFRDRIYK